MIRAGTVFSRKGVVALAASCIALLCGGSLCRGATTAGPPVLQVVALGDSDAAGNGDPTGQGWVGRYADLLRKRRGLTVSVANLALDGQTSAQLVASVRTTPSIRTKLRAADIVLFGVGGADLNAGDARWQAGSCSGPPCYRRDIEQLGRNLAATVAAVRQLRGSRKTAFRAITFPNPYPGALDVLPAFLRPTAVQLGVYQASNLGNQICAVMVRSHGRCIEELHHFNGPSGTEDAYKKGLMNHADCCYPSGKGQQLLAELLYRTGLAPIRH